MGADVPAQQEAWQSCPTGEPSGSSAPGHTRHPQEARSAHMPAGCTWPPENPLLLGMSVDAGVERFPAKFQVSAPPVLLRRDNFAGRGALRFSAACGLSKWRPVDCNCVVFVVLVEVQKGQKTPLVACAVLEHQSQVRQLPSRASLTALSKAVRAPDWLQASVLTKLASSQILMP